MEGSKFTSSFSADLLTGNSVKLHPRATNPLVFFTPSFVEFAMDGKCLPPVSFKAELGVVIEGSVTPYVEGIEVTAVT